jgi:hypothetical protein
MPSLAVLPRPVQLRRCCRSGGCTPLRRTATKPLARRPWGWGVAGIRGLQAADRGDYEPLLLFLGVT